ncbi:hypothetical protein CDAR_472491 [Caerostris darwini]|uniref:Uncharacterized protein n=1 Tax=Caerostris darwini TaxID=1538125 RepID=A0AAV4VJ68_9ARAC|nr:hypothetical protein CDAR_472491 [Caerostris darwini]
MLKTCTSKLLQHSVAIVQVIELYNEGRQCNLDSSELTSIRGMSSCKTLPFRSSCRTKELMDYSEMESLTSNLREKVELGKMFMEFKNIELSNF